MRGAADLRSARLALAVLVLMSAPATAADTTIFTVPGDKARCVAQHARIYAKLPKDPLVVFLNLCPIAQPTPGDLSRLNRASSYVGIKERPPADRPRSVLVLTKAQFACFVRQVERQGGRRPAAGALRIDLSRC